MEIAHNFWSIAFPRCQAPDCQGRLRVWRRIRWQHGGVRLHGAWYCGPQCLESALCRHFAHARIAVLPTPPVKHRIPLGLLLLSRGELTNPQLRLALEAQQNAGCGQIGYWLKQLGLASEQQITVALGLQWACPVLPSKAVSDFCCAGLLPYRLLERLRMLPVRFLAPTRVLYVAFSQGVDYTSLYAIEQMLSCRTEACLVDHSTMDSVLERIARDRRPTELLFEGWRDVEEMARIACGYVIKLGVREVRVVTCGEFVWVRLESSEEITDLLFRRPNEVIDEREARLASSAPYRGPSPERNSY